MKRLTLIPMLFVAFIACNKKPAPPTEYGRCGVTCILNKISEFAQSDDICDTTATVKLYHFQNQDVYLFDQGSCGNDLTIPVLNEDCDTLGYLGGIMGNSTINGQDFYANASYRYTVWNN